MVTRCMNCHVTRQVTEVLLKKPYAISIEVDPEDVVDVDRDFSRRTWCMSCYTEYVRLWKRGDPKIENYWSN